MNGAHATEQTSLIQADKFEQVYDFLRRDVRETRSKVFIFVANDIDSICSLHIIQELFKEDLIPYSYRPVSSYEEMYQVAETNMQDAEIKNIILINCGGMIDIYDLLRPTLGAEPPKLWIIDSHRPFHLKNIHRPGEIYLLDLPVDDELEQERMRVAEDAAATGGESDSDEDSSGSDTSAHSSSSLDRARGARKFRRLDRVPARHKLYYQVSSYAYPSSCVAWKLTGSRGTSDLCWWVAVALSDAYQHNRLSKEQYNQLVKEVKGAIDGRILELSERGVEFVEQELAFLLHRHWGLLDAMIHSRYLGTRLGIWTEDGKRKLHTMLARMGVSLDQASRVYIDLEPEYRERLLLGLQTHAAEYGLPRYAFPSFVRRLTPKLQVSAADVVHALVGILASPASNPGVAPGGPQSAQNERLPDWADNWYRAWDALSPGREELLVEGIEAAKKLSVAVLDQASLMLSKDIVLMVGPYRLAFLSEYLPLFTNELALVHLAEFIDGALVEYRKKPPKALLICVFNQPRGTYRMLGYVGDKPNVFGTAFRDVALKIKVSILSHGFDHAAIEVGQPDVKRLLEFIKPTIANLMK